MSLRYNSGHPQWLSGKKSACKAGETGDASSISESGRYPGERNGNLFFLQYFSMGNPMDRGAWQATVSWGCNESGTTEHTCKQV